MYHDCCTISLCTSAQTVKGTLFGSCGHNWEDQRQNGIRPGKAGGELMVIGKVEASIGSLLIKPKGKLGKSERQDLAL